MRWWVLRIVLLQVRVRSLLLQVSLEVVTALQLPARRSTTRFSFSFSHYDTHASARVPWICCERRASLHAPKFGVGACVSCALNVFVHVKVVNILTEIPIVPGIVLGTPHCHGAARAA